MFTKAVPFDVEEVDDDSSSSEVWLHFSCPECDLTRSIACHCGAGGGEGFFCGCVPQDCPVCGHHLHDQEPAKVSAPVRQRATSLASNRVSFA